MSNLDIYIASLPGLTDEELKTEARSAASLLSRAKKSGTKKAILNLEKMRDAIAREKKNRKDTAMPNNPKKKKKAKKMGKAERTAIGAGIGALALGPAGAIGGAYLGSKYRAEKGGNPSERNPLAHIPKGASIRKIRSVVSQNIAAEIEGGKPQKQAVAIAIRSARDDATKIGGNTAKLILAEYSRQNPELPATGTLPKDAMPMYEAVFNSAYRYYKTQRGATKKQAEEIAARTAWDEIKRYYVKKGKGWIKRKKPLPQVDRPHEIELTNPGDVIPIGRAVGFKHYGEKALPREEETILISVPKARAKSFEDIEIHRIKLKKIREKGISPTPENIIRYMADKLPDRVGRFTAHWDPREEAVAIAIRETAKGDLTFSNPSKKNPTLIRTKETDPYDVRLYKYDDGSYWYQIYDPVMKMNIDEDWTPRSKTEARKEAIKKIKEEMIVLNPPEGNPRSTYRVKVVGRLYSLETGDEPYQQELLVEAASHDEARKKAEMKISERAEEMGGYEFYGKRKDFKSEKIKRNNPKKKYKSSPAQSFIKKCQKTWEQYCAKPSKARLKKVFLHLEKMENSGAKSVKDELRRCRRVARIEAKKLGLKI